MLGVSVLGQSVVKCEKTDERKCLVQRSVATWCPQVEFRVVDSGDWEACAPESGCGRRCGSGRSFHRPGLKYQWDFAQR